MKRICVKCNLEFRIKPSQLKVKGGGKYCSKICFYNRTKIAKICEICSKPFVVSPSLKRLFCCSRECQYKRIKKKHLNIYCSNCGQLFHRSKSLQWKVNCCSKKCGYEYQSKHPHTDISKEKNPSWKGGITPEHKAIRMSRKYKNWRKQVFKRDNYTCQLCNKRGGKIEADHIKSFSKYPELRFKLSNGRTLCKSCHNGTDNYGFKAL